MGNSFTSDIGPQNTLPKILNHKMLRLDIITGKQ